ncbi:hypothetical protein J6590_063081 [Homalodisca vitripennis]|nr:hypothetical protein J6590_063081 [Homalodisca vitripennis]
MTNIPRELKETVQRVSGCHVEGRQARIQQHQPANEDHRPLPHKRQSHIWPRVVDKKHPTCCSQCGKGVCKAHSEQETVCESCVD